MTAAEFMGVLLPDLAWFHSVVPSVPASAEEQMALLVDAGQESGWRNVAQTGSGDARGPWQMQLNTCADILSNRATDATAVIVCLKLKIAPTETAIFDALLTNSKLAAAMIRLDYFADPHPFAAIGNEEAAWLGYVRVSRPGAVAAGGQSAIEARARFATIYPQCLAAVQAV